MVLPSPAGPEQAQELPGATAVAGMAQPRQLSVILGAQAALGLQHSSCVPSVPPSIAVILAGFTPKAAAP